MPSLPDEWWRRWRQWRWLVLEAFVIANLAFLALDIALAHSFNRFAHPAEWIPLAFSLAAPPLLVGLAAAAGGRPPAGASRWIGLATGALAIAVGVAGMLWHLESAFFRERTLESLIYSAPFVAPLAYAGLGFLILLNRMVPTGTAEWARWIVFFAAGGFVGNFGLSLADHAQNGFFDPLEWIPVVSGAFAVGFLAVGVVARALPPLLWACAVVMAIQVVVGLLGAGLHVVAVLETPAQGWLGPVIYGAPPFAPLLFVDLALLAAIGLADLAAEAPREPALAPEGAG